MSDMSVSGVGRSSGYNSQMSVSEQDFAQLKKSAETTNNEDQSQDRLLTPAEQEEQQQSLFAPGTVTEETVSPIVEAVNDYMSQIDCNLELSYSKEANAILVKITDKETGKIIKEFPSEEMIEKLVEAKENGEEMRGVFVNRMA